MEAFMKKLYLSIIYVFMLSLLISGTILLSKPQAKHVNTRAAYPPEAEVNKTKSYNKPGNGLNSVKVQDNINYRKIENLKILNNNQEINIQANLVEDKYGLTALKLTYRIDGRNVSQWIDSTKFKELRYLYALREKQPNSYRIKDMVLNEKLRKLYFLFEGKADSNYPRTSMFSYDLNSSRLKKLYYVEGSFDKFALTSDGKYNACSYTSQPQNIINNELKTVVVFRCKDDFQVFNSSKDIKPEKTVMTSEMYVYSYDFLKWKDNDTLELRQEIRAKDKREKVKENILSYNLRTKTFSK